MHDGWLAATSLDQATGGPWAPCDARKRVSPVFDTDTAKGVLTVIGAVSTLLGFAKSVQLWVWKRKLTWNDA